MKNYKVFHIILWFKTQKKIKVENKCKKSYGYEMFSLFKFKFLTIINLKELDYFIKYFNKIIFFKKHNCNLYKILLQIKNENIH